MRPRRLGVIATLVLVAAPGLVACARACSQCLCGSPTPPGYLVSDFNGRLAFGLEDRYLSKRNDLDDAPGVERQTEHRISGLVMFRPAERIALQARVPYAFKTNVRAAAGAAEEITRAQGLSDAELLARLDFLRFGGLVQRTGVLSLVAGATVPTGSNDARDATGERMDAHLQPGAGAASGSLGLASDAIVGRGAINASILGRWNGTNGHGYHYGDAALANLGYSRLLRPGWQAALELNGRWAARDRVEDGGQDPNSGGGLLYAAPSVRWSGGGPIAVDLLVQVPVAQALNGTQVERTTARLTVSLNPR